MPSKTPKQKRTMAAAAHNPAFAKKVGIPQKVAKEFNAADTNADPPEPDEDDAPKKRTKRTGAGSPHGPDHMWGEC